MPTLRYRIVNVFAESALAGNPLCVFEDGSGVQVLQGDQVGRPCRLGLKVDKDGQIFVSGRVIALGRGEISL